MKPEEKAREQIDDQLRAADWTVQPRDAANLPEPDVLAVEIVDDLEAALEQFRAIAEDVGEEEIVPKAG